MPRHRLQAQVWNHIDWLESRGLTAYFPRDPTHPVDLSVSLPDPSHILAKPETSSPRNWRLGFYTESELHSTEHEMLLRIIHALGFDAENVLIGSKSPIARELFLHCRYIVVLGPAGFQTLVPDKSSLSSLQLHAIDHSRQLLIIPHPNAMLRDPSLKITAWAALQKLKLALSC